VSNDLRVLTNDEINLVSGGGKNPPGSDLPGSGSGQGDGLGWARKVEAAVVSAVVTTVTGVGHMFGLC
jgi:hypothetical protein